MKVDLHVHTHYSKCANLKFEDLRKLTKKFNIFPAITDHNKIEGAVKFKDCIIGEEINTTEGEIIGLFLNERIKPYLSIEETIEKIKEQGGIVYIPHPYDWIRINHIKRMDFKINLIEVFNGRVIQQKVNKKAVEFAEKNNIIKGVGSDTHNKLEFGRIYNEIEEFNSPKEFLKNMKKAKLVMNQHPLFVHAVVMSKSLISKYL